MYILFTAVYPAIAAANSHLQRQLFYAIIVLTKFIAQAIYATQNTTQ